MQHRITLAVETDLPLVYQSWLMSYRYSPHCRKWSDASYAAYQRPKIDSILARSTLLIARPVDWDDGILAWLCYEQTGSSYYLHYAYTKTTYRQHGLATALLAASDPQGGLYYTHLRPPYTGFLPSGFSYRKLHR